MCLLNRKGYEEEYYLLPGLQRVTGWCEVIDRI